MLLTAWPCTMTMSLLSEELNVVGGPGRRRNGGVLLPYVYTWGRFDCRFSYLWASHNLINKHKDKLFCSLCGLGVMLWPVQATTTPLLLIIILNISLVSYFVSFREKETAEEHLLLGEEIIRLEMEVEEIQEGKFATTPHAPTPMVKVTVWVREATISRGSDIFSNKQNGGHSTIGWRVVHSFPLGSGHVSTIRMDEKSAAAGKPPTQLFYYYFDAVDFRFAEKPRQDQPPQTQ